MSKLAMLVVLLAACGSKSSPPTTTAPLPVGGACEKGGCSGTACAEPGKQVMTTCEYKPEYACYQTAACERQSDGQCGWTQSPDLVGCLANPPPMAGAPEHPPVPTPQSPVGSVTPKPM